MRTASWNSRYSRISTPNSTAWRWAFVMFSKRSELETQSKYLMGTVSKPSGTNLPFRTFTTARNFAEILYDFIH
jgi:hypothetical protein